MSDIVCFPVIFSVTTDTALLSNKSNKINVFEYSFINFIRTFGIFFSRTQDLQKFFSIAMVVNQMSHVVNQMSHVVISDV